MGEYEIVPLKFNLKARVMPTDPELREIDGEIQAATVIRIDGEWRWIKFDDDSKLFGLKGTAIHGESNNRIKKFKYYELEACAKPKPVSPYRNGDWENNEFLSFGSPSKYKWEKQWETKPWGRRRLFGSPSLHRIRRLRR